MSLRQELRDALARDDLAAAEALLAANRGGLRHVTGLTYHHDPDTRQRAARAIALTAKHHPKQVAETIRRLVWAMGEGSGTNATFAPETLRVIAGEAPELLLPMVHDLMLLVRDDPSLREGLSETLRVVAEGCRGQVGKQIASEIRSSAASAAGGRHGA